MNVSFGFNGNLSDSFFGRTFYDLNFELGLREGDTSRSLASRIGGHGKIFTTQLNITRLQSAKILNSYFTLKFQGQANNTRALSSYLMGIVGGWVRFAAIPYRHIKATGATIFRPSTRCLSHGRSNGTAAFLI